MNALKPVPAWAVGDFVSVTRTAHELSILCPALVVPNDIECSQGWHCLRIEGPLDHGMVGVIASIVQPLADSRISVLTVATYQTDFLFVRDLRKATEVLRAAGFVVD